MTTEQMAPPHPKQQTQRRLVDLAPLGTSPLGTAPPGPAPTQPALLDEAGELAAQLLELRVLVLRLAGQGSNEQLGLQGAQGQELLGAAKLDLDSKLAAKLADGVPSLRGIGCHELPGPAKELAHGAHAHGQLGAPCTFGSDGFRSPARLRSESETCELGAVNSRYRGMIGQRQREKTAVGRTRQHERQEEQRRNGAGDQQAQADLRAHTVEELTNLHERAFRS